MKFVIIGGDAAGMSAASRAKRLKPDMEVIVLEKTNDVSYSACGMPYNIADSERDIDKLIVRRADVFIEKNKINLLISHKAEAINPIQKKVSVKGPDGKIFDISYDKLLIATGASPKIPDLPGFNTPSVMPLKSLEHGRKIKDYIEKNDVKRAIIVGMGFIALEMCEAFRKRKIDVSMVKPGNIFLPWLKSELADIVKEELIENNIKLYTGHKIKEITSLDKGVELICEGVTIIADMVLVASGVTPCSQIAKDAGLELGIADSIAVNKKLQSSNEDIYAAGDCADSYHIVTGKKCWIPLALRANRAGWAVADNVCEIEKSLCGVAGTSVFKVFSLEVARCGLNLKEAIDEGFEAVENMVKTRSRAHGHLGSNPIYVNMVAEKKTGRILGAQMVGKDGVAHRINAVSVALFSKMTLSDFAENDFAYAPPFGPVWDPLLTAATQLIKKI